MANVYDSVGRVVAVKVTLADALNLVGEHDDWTFVEVN